jgi:hypothetical protein
LLFKGLSKEIATNDQIVVQAIIAYMTLENISHQSSWMKKVDNHSTLCKCAKHFSDHVGHIKFV